MKRLKRIIIAFIASTLVMFPLAYFKVDDFLSGWLSCWVFSLVYLLPNSKKWNY